MRALAALCAALSLLVAGCTGDTDRAAGPEATATAPGRPSETPATTPAPEITESPSFTPEDAVLNVAIPQPATLDPMLLGDPGSVLVARQLYEGLTAWDPGREEVVPAAAASWDVRRDGRRFVFHLREGMEFHDGTPVTAADFAFAFDRIARRRNASDLAYTLQRLEGFEAVNRFAIADHLRGVTVRGDSTLVMELKQPYQEFPAVLTHPGLVPVPKKAARDLDTFLREPVGNGPFRIARPWEPDGPVVLEAFDGFYDPPRLDGIQFLPFADAAESWISFDKGDVQVAEVPVGQVQTAADAYGTRGYMEFLTGYYYAFNLEAKGLGNARVRKAASLAVDRRRIVERVYKGSMEPMDGIVPPAMPGFQTSACDDACGFDTSAARRIVAKLPRKSRSISLEFTRGRPHAEVAASIVRDLEAVGFRVTTSSFRFPEYLKLLTDGRQGFYRLGWIAEYPSPDVFLGALFGSRSPDNHSGFGSRRVDRLLRKAHREPDEARRVRLYKKAERAIVRARAVVPIGSFIHRWAARPEVEDIAFDAMGGFDAATVTLSGED